MMGKKIKTKARFLKRKKAKSGFAKTNSVVVAGNGVKFLEVESPKKRIVTVKKFNEDRNQLMKIFAD